VGVVDKIQQALAAGIQPIPLGRTLGFEVSSVERGRAVIQMETGPEHYNPMGTLHGGVLCAVADSAMGIAHSSLLDEGEASTTLELKINFLRPVWRSKLRAVGAVANAGRTVSLLECDIFDEKDRLIARASCTCLTLRGQQAEGRTFSDKRTL
jgi:uncharacterized protein (TIGR00369 family)